MLEWLTGRTARVEAKASRGGALAALSAAGRPVWTARNAVALTRAGYLRNLVVHRASRLVAQAAASADWLVVEGGAELREHPALTLLGRPNPAQGGAEFFEALFTHLLLAGNAYIEAVTAEEEIRELHLLRPDRMSVVPDAGGWPAAYDYQLDGRTVRFRQDGDVPPILHLKSFHPLDDHYGLSALEPAAASLDLHNAASAWNKALLDNAARPSGALVYQGRDGANLSEDQFARLREELTANFSGAGNAGRPLLLDGGLSWQAMSLSPRDLDFLEAKHAAAREIALAFGVPPMLLGIPGDNTYSNYKEANAAFWRETVLPLIGRTAGALAEWLRPAWGGEFQLRADLDAFPALSADRDSLWARVTAADFLSADEKREAVGYGRRDAG